ncbi:MAG: hypothetical protein LBC71_02445 [Oscillospiraceae bacterium]|jgi:hypothetical protein|nr:hypothetical protein [Oscillospiraceae bacterium]
MKKLAIIVIIISAAISIPFNIARAEWTPDFDIQIVIIDDETGEPIDYDFTQHQPIQVQQAPVERKVIKSISIDTVNLPESSSDMTYQFLELIQNEGYILTNNGIQHVNNTPPVYIYHVAIQIMDGYELSEDYEVYFYGRRLETYSIQSNENYRYLYVQYQVEFPMIRIPGNFHEIETVIQPTPTPEPPGREPITIDDENIQALIDTIENAKDELITELTLIKTIIIVLLSLIIGGIIGLAAISKWNVGV